MKELFRDVFITCVEPSHSKQEQVEVELANYKSESVIGPNGSALSWWSERKMTYPILSKVAMSHLVTQATSVPSERVFSSAEDIVNAQRACLSGDHIDKLIFLKKNYQM